VKYLGRAKRREGQKGAMVTTPVWKLNKDHKFEQRAISHEPLGSGGSDWCQS